MSDVLWRAEYLLRLRNHSLKTCKAYFFYIKDYIAFYKKHGIKNKQKAIEKFLLEQHRKKQSPQIINLTLNAVKFLYAEVLKNPQKIDLEFAKYDKNTSNCLFLYNRVDKLTTIFHSFVTHLTNPKLKNLGVCYEFN